MKTLLTLLAVVYCTLFSSAYAQIIEVKSSLNSSIDTKGNVVLTGSQIELNNVTILCNLLTIKSGVTKIRISGTVKIDCRNLVLEANASGIELEKSTGNFSIDYAEGFVDNGRSFIIVGDEELKIKMLKKPVKK